MKDVNEDLLLQGQTYSFHIALASRHSLALTSQEQCWTTCMTTSLPPLDVLVIQLQDCHLKPFPYSLRNKSLMTTLNGE